MKSVVVLDMKKFKEASEYWKEENILDVDDVGIEEFLYLIRKSSALLTDSHHGACFAIIYQKMFYTIKNPRRGETRFESLFHLLGIENYLLEEGNLCNDIRKMDGIDYSNIDSILFREREKSKAWLKNALEKTENKKMPKEDLFAEYFCKANELEVKNSKLEKHID